MTDLSPMAGPMADVFLSGAAIAGLLTVQRTILARDRKAGLNRRFLFAIRVVMVLFAGRALYLMFGGAPFRAVLLTAAAMVPLAVLVLTEGLLRRHAPGWVKTGVGTATVAFVILALFPAALVDPARLVGLLIFQAVTFVLVGWLVVSRDRAGLSAAENLMVSRLALSLVLLIPAAAGDFLVQILGLPVQVSPLAVLFLCWLTVSLGRAEAGQWTAVRGFIVIVCAAGAATGLVTMAADLTASGAVLTGAAVLAAMLVAAIWNDAVRAVEEERSMSLLDRMAGAGDDPITFLRSLQADPMVEGAVLLDLPDLADLDPATLNRIFDRSPVVRRAQVAGHEATEAEHLAHLFARFDATHLICATRSPLRLLALNMPTLATSPRAELELRVVQRMAMLMGGRTHG